MKKVYIIAAISALLDQIIKYIFELNLNSGESITIIPNFFSFTLIGNTGAAFSILNSNTIFLIIISLVALNLIYIYFLKGKELKLKEEVTFGILTGGILGNLVDRIFKGEVIDYLDFTIFSYNFPIFNLADIMIVLSVIYIALIMFRGEKNEDKS